MNNEGDLFSQVSAITKAHIQELEMAKNEIETKTVRRCSTCPMADMAKGWCYHHRAAIRQMDGPGPTCPFPMEREGVLFVIEQKERR